MPSFYSNSATGTLHYGCLVGVRFLSKLEIKRPLLPFRINKPDVES